MRPVTFGFPCRARARVRHQAHITARSRRHPVRRTRCQHLVCNSSMTSSTDERSIAETAGLRLGPDAQSLSKGPIARPRKVGTSRRESTNEVPPDEAHSRVAPFWLPRRSGRSRVECLSAATVADTTWNINLPCACMGELQRWGRVRMMNGKLSLLVHNCAFQ